MQVSALFRTLIARGVPESTAKGIADDVADMNAGTIGQPNDAGFPGNRDVVRGSDDSPGPRGMTTGAHGAAADELSAEYSDVQNQGPVQNQYQELGAALAESIASTVAKSMTSGFDKLEVALSTLADEVRGGSRDSKGRLIPGGAKPPSFAKAAPVVEKAVPELAKASALLSAAIGSAADHCSLSERLSMQRLRTVWNQHNAALCTDEDWRKAVSTTTAAARACFEAAGIL